VLKLLLVIYDRDRQSLAVGDREERSDFNILKRNVKLVIKALAKRTKERHPQADVHLRAAVGNPHRRGTGIRA
jgi:hypothetical protein